jgi:hypothetical protein
MGLLMGVLSAYVSFLVRYGILFCFHQVFGEGLESRYSPKLVGKFWDLKTWGEVG